MATRPAPAAVGQSPVGYKVLQLDQGVAIAEHQCSSPDSGPTKSWLNMYKGTLGFDDGDEIVVNALIIRDNEIAFDFTASWGDHGRWSRSGSAHKVGSEFVSTVQTSKHAQTGVIGYPCKITIFAAKIMPLEIDISGKWEEQGESFAFNGTLKQMS